MGMLGVMRGEMDAPDDVRLRSQCVWCNGRDYSIANTIQIYTTVGAFEITLIFCSFDHSDKFMETYDMTCIYDAIHDYCRRAVKSEGYTLKSSNSIFDVRTMSVDVNIDGTLRAFMVDCRKDENVKEEKESD